MKPISKPEIELHRGEGPALEPAFIKPKWWADPDSSNNKTNQLRHIVKDFLQGNLKPTSVRRGTHIYSAKNFGKELWLFKDNRSLKIRICIARKVGHIFVGNASSLLITRQHNGNLYWNGGGQFRIQSVLEEVMPMIPFQLFRESRLPLKHMRIIEKGQPEVIELKRWWVKGKEAEKIQKQHFTGALLFAIKDKHFLFDIDRNDLAMWNFNAFLSEVDGTPLSIRQAYELLKPQVVRDAERFLRKECPRQGEWFFIPVPGEFKSIGEGNLFNGISNPHHVKYRSSEGYVTGWVTHARGSHVPIKLEGWHKPVPNTAAKSFKITGAID